MAAHRFWALLVTARPNTGNGVGIAEVIARAVPGGPNLATGGVASGTNNVGHSPANAFDGSAATEWRDGATGGLPVRLSYDFGSAVSLAEMVVTTPGAASPYKGSVYGPAACWVQWSDDGVAWRYGRGTADLSGLGDAASATLTGVSDAAPTARLVDGLVRVPPGSPMPLTPGYRQVGQIARYDAADGGPYRVAGTVAIDGTPATPVRRRVRLFHRLSGRLVREVWSDTAGAFSFDRVANAQYLVVADDYTGVYEAEAADRVQAVP